MSEFKATHAYKGGDEANHVGFNKGGEVMFVKDDKYDPDVTGEYISKGDAHSKGLTQWVRKDCMEAL